MGRLGPVGAGREQRSRPAQGRPAWTTGGRWAGTGGRGTAGPGATSERQDPACSVTPRTAGAPLLQAASARRAQGRFRPTRESGRPVRGGRGVALPPPQPSAPSHPRVRSVWNGSSGPAGLVPEPSGSLPPGRLSPDPLRQRAVPEQAGPLQGVCDLASDAGRRPLTRGLRVRVCTRVRVRVWFSEDVPAGRGSAA